MKGEGCSVKGAGCSVKGVGCSVKGRDMQRAARSLRVFHDVQRRLDQPPPRPE